MAEHVRHATREDITDIDRLARAAQAEDGVPRLSAGEIEELMLFGDWLVLEDDTGEIAGAACLTTARSSGYLACVVVHPAAPASVEGHLLDVAAGLCEARRCTPRFAGSWHVARAS